MEKGIETIKETLIGLKYDLKALAKNEGVMGQWHDSINKALLYIEKAYESLEGIQGGNQNV